MSIIAYASANINPVANPLEDAEIDLSVTNTPATVQLYGDAVDTADPSASFSWDWTLLYPETGVTLSSATTQNITVSNITDWQNIRLHLVATNTATAETSETDILLAPSASFVEIRVLSENRGIQKIARGSRSWHTALDLWATAIENSAETLNQLSDVPTATGAQLEILVGGGNAESGGSVLHTHDGDHIANATTSTAGVVKLEEASEAIGVPVVLTNERIILNGSAEKSHDGTTLYDSVLYQSGTSILPHASWVLADEVTITKYAIFMGDAGALGSTTWSLCTGTETDYKNRTMSVVSSSSVTQTVTVAHTPLAIEYTLPTPLALTPDKIIGIMISAGTTTEADGMHMVSFTVEGRRAIT